MSSRTTIRPLSSTLSPMKAQSTVLATVVTPEIGSVIDMFVLKIEKLEDNGMKRIAIAHIIIESLHRSDQRALQLMRINIE